MALSVRLDAKTERLVENLAKKRGQTKSEVIRDALGVLAQREAGGNGKKRPYEFVSHLIGCVRGGPPDHSAHTGKKLTEHLMRRRKKT